MRFTSIVAIALSAAMATSAAVPEPLSARFDRLSTLTARSCDCKCNKDCSTDCANGFALNPVGQGACILTCGDSCGCGPNTLCCEDGSSCDGSKCCEK